MKSAKFLLCCIIGLAINLSSVESQQRNYEEGATFWESNALSHLEKMIKNQDMIKKKAKNVVFFVGDGMGISTITAGRIYKAQQLSEHSREGYKLSFEKFPYTALSKTYSADTQVTDSAAGATALFSGVKGNNAMLGLEAKSKKRECKIDVYDSSKVETIASWAQKSGKDTGFVTTTRITHATPAGLYAHSNDRDWECDSDMPQHCRNSFKDIARQLFEDEPGKNFKVIMGGGWKYLCPDDGLNNNCMRQDQRNLINEWKKRNRNGTYVTSAKRLMSLKIKDDSKILGIFGPTHLDYQAEKNPRVPSLANMTKQAIRRLKRNKNGFFLMVEGGKIDKAHHSNKARLALDELSDFDDAVRVAINELNLEESLLIVTADHSHSFVMNGYANRGRDILGLVSDEPDAYEILSYTNGPSFAYHRVTRGPSVDNTWRILFGDESRKNINYQHLAARYKDVDTHAGEDVAVYAIGPYSHLFKGTVEQNYIPYAIAYAACYEGHLSHCK